MMKLIQTSIIRAVVSIIIGALLIKYKEEMVTWLTILVGVLFLISGLISCITYAVNKKHINDTIVYDANGNQLTGMKPAPPIVGIGSIILGGILMFIPHTFLTGIVYIFALILIIGAINQFAVLASINRNIGVNMIYWLLPTTVLLIGLIAIVKPTWIASAPFLMIGWTMVSYGIIECINCIKLVKVNKKFTENKVQSHMSNEIGEETEGSETK